MSSYPIRVLSFGAGVQSTTLLRMMIAGEIEPVEHAIFADTGWEPAGVYDHLQVMRAEAEAAGIEFHIVSLGNIRADALAPAGRFASMPFHIATESGEQTIARRQCTYEYKLKPLLTKEREIAGLKKGDKCKEHRITTIIGISWDEMQRMKAPAFSWIQNEYPLVDRRLTRHDCLEWHRIRALSLPPRSACIGCPFHQNDYWRNMKLNDPISWADAVEFDEAIRSTKSKSLGQYEQRVFLHRSLKPLSEVDLRNEEDLGQLSMFDMECEGMCGL